MMVRYQYLLIRTLTYKFRMYPTPTQERVLQKHLEVSRFAYNKLLWYKRNIDACGIYTTKSEMDRLLTTWKGIFPELRTIHSKVLQKVNHNLWDNIASLRERRKNGHKTGKLRFKSKGWHKTLNYNQSGFDLFEDRNRINFSKIGEIKTIIHRQVEGKIKGIIIKRTKTNKWFALVQAKVEVTPLPPTAKAVGIDLNLKDFAVDSDGLAFANPRYIKEMLPKLQNVQKNLSRKRKGSKNYEKVRMELLLLYEQLYNRRKDFLDKMVFYYIHNYGLIGIEQLDLDGMLTFHPRINGKLLKKGFKKAMNRHLLDASFKGFRDKLVDKAESAGRQVVEVNPMNTTQRCSRCRELPTKRKDLGVRTHVCEHCGFSTHRDLNSSHNILHDTLCSTSGWGPPGVPVEDLKLTRVSYRKLVSGTFLQSRKPLVEVLIKNQG